METRKITVVSTATQRKSVVETNATTLSELKAALAAANIEYSGMTFYEGLTHTELLSDDAILPHDVPYKGTTTNELVFMLTNPNKKIRSGALSDVRTALYAEIENRNLSSVIMERLGKNYTNCKNSELAAIIEEFSGMEPVAAQVEDSQLREAFKLLVNSLVDDDTLDEYQASEILAPISGDDAPAETLPYTNEELDKMFDFVR